jgi:arginase
MNSYSIIEVPYHLGLQDVSVGKGPALLLGAGIDHLLSRRGMPATVNHVRPRDLRSQGMDAVVDINRMLRYVVKEASEQETVPVVVAGNCNSAIGTLAGLGDRRLGIVWLDRHGDLNTPETTISGSFEGMVLATALGFCHKEFCERIGLLEPISEQNTILAGFWDLDPGEKARLENSWISAHPADSLALLPVALNQLANNVDAVYLHIDTDFLTGNIEDPVGLVRLVLESVPLGAVGITNYNPDLDTDRQWLKAILPVVQALQPRAE